VSTCLLGGHYPHGSGWGTQDAFTGRIPLTILQSSRSAIRLLASLALVEERHSQKTGHDRASMFTSALYGIRHSLGPLPELCDQANHGDSGAALDAHAAHSLIEVVGDVVWCDEVDGTIAHPDYADIGQTLLLTASMLDAAETKLKAPQKPTGSELPVH
jgi:hypothetical protein